VNPPKFYKNSRKLSVADSPPFGKIGLHKKSALRMLPDALLIKVRRWKKSN